MNRVSQVYQIDMGTVWKLVDNQAMLNDVLFSNRAKIENNSDLDGIHQVITATIGADSFDLGHLFGIGSGGLGGTGLCNAAAKGRGQSSVAKPVGDSFAVDFVCHEIGHQCSLPHTFSGDDENCKGNNRANEAAFEPGSGSTVMAYASVCGKDNIQGKSDTRFHSVSIQQFKSFVSTLACGVDIVNTLTPNNTAPLARSKPEGAVFFTLPRNTTFRMFGTGSDAETQDSNLKYSFEEGDLCPGPYGLEVGKAADIAPFFRSFDYSSDNWRIFPSPDTFRGIDVPGERLPVAGNKSLTMRFTVRDMSGGVSSDDVTLKIQDFGAATFALSTPLTSEVRAGESLTVLWNVAGTGTLCPFVNIFLLTNEGRSWSKSDELAHNVANSGSATFVVPSVPGQLVSIDSARLVVECNFATSKIASKFDGPLTCVCANPIEVFPNVTLPFDIGRATLENSGSKAVGFSVRGPLNVGCVTVENGWNV